MEDKKAQSAIEFLILVGVVFFFFVVFLVAIQGSISEKGREKVNLEIKEVAIVVRDEIVLAVESSDGYSRTFTLPGKVVNRDYNVSIVDQVVYVVTVDGRNALTMPVLNITGQPVKGDNVIGKVDGQVYLNA